jgi:hypothetical protein
MLNFWHILLRALVDIDEDSAVTSLIGVVEVSPLSIEGRVSASSQHNSNRLATSCLFSFSNDDLEAAAGPSFAAKA